MNRLAIRLTAALAAGLALTACATQSYTNVSSFSALEAANYDCSALTREYVQTRLVQKEINGSSAISLKTLRSLPVDYGIGNILARSDAKASAGERLGQIRLTMAAKGCKAVKDEADAPDNSLVTRITDNSLVKSANRLLRGK